MNELFTMTDLALTLKDLSDLFSSSVGQTVLIAAGLLLCFFGYKLTKILSGLFGIVFGFLLAYVIAFYGVVSVTGFLNILLTVVLGLLFASFFGYFSFARFQVGVFLFCMTLGIAVGSVPALALFRELSPTFIALVLLCGVLCGALGLLFLKPVVIVATSLGGMLAAAPLLELAGQSDEAYSTLFGVMLTGLGVVVQWRMNRDKYGSVFEGGPKPEHSFWNASDKGAEPERKSEPEPQPEPQPTPPPAPPEPQPQPASPELQPQPASPELRTVHTASWQDKPAEPPQPPQSAWSALREEWESNGVLLVLLRISPIAALVATVAAVAFGMEYAQGALLLLPLVCLAGELRGCALVCGGLMARELWETYTCYQNLSYIHAGVAAAGAAVYLIGLLASLGYHRSTAAKKTAESPADPAPTTGGFAPVDDTPPERTADLDGTAPIHGYYETDDAQHTQRIPRRDFFDAEADEMRTQAIPRP